MAQADIDTSTVTDEPESRPGGIPLFAWVIGAAALAVPVGLFAPKELYGVNLATTFDLFGTLIIRALTALATPLVFLAILSAIVTNDVRGRQGGRMMLYYLINTIVAITIGLVASNLIHPGRGAKLRRGLRSAAAPAGARPRPRASPTSFSSWSRPASPTRSPGTTWPNWWSWPWPWGSAWRRSATSSGPEG